MPNIQTLTVSELAEGRDAAFNNARELVAEAELLLKSGRHARALFLAQIAGEEVGKGLLLAGYTFSLLRGSLDWKRFWKSFRSHAHKLEAVMMTESLLVPTLRDDERQSELDTLKERASHLEQGKMAALYVDYLSGHFCLPQSVISSEMASHSLEWAKGRLAMIREIEKVYAHKPPENWSQKEIQELEAHIKEAMNAERGPSATEETQTASQCGVEDEGPK